LYRTGYELTDTCSKFPQFSSEKIAHTLKFFISELKIKKGIEKNLLARKFIKKIIYSAENIKICFISRQNPVDFGNSKSPALQKQDGAERLGGEKENPISLQNNKFVFERLAPAPGFEPGTHSLHLFHCFQWR